eukprot:UN14611
MLIVDEYWAAHPELQNIPIYYASNMAKKSMQVYTTFRNMMSDRFQDDISLFNPFDFRHIKNLKSRGQFQDIGPSVFLLHLVCFKVECRENFSSSGHQNEKMLLLSLVIVFKARWHEQFKQNQTRSNL